MLKGRFILFLLLFSSLNIQSQILHSIPFRCIDNRIYLQGIINGKPCSLLFDTGAFDFPIR